MKNIFDLLKDAGIEIPEEKKSGFDKAFGENYKTVAEMEKIRTKSEDFEKQLKTATESLKKFDGVNVEELNGMITELNTQLADQKKASDERIAGMEFDYALENAIAKTGAKNAKTVKALLDVDALRASKNLDTDLKTALDAVKTENDYLFASDEPIKNPTGQVNPGNGAADNALRAAFGLPAKD